MSALSGLGTIIDALANPSVAGGSALTGDDLVQFTTETSYALQIIKDVLETKTDEARGQVTVATDAGSQAEKIGQNVKDITHRIVDTIIPHSTAWAIGYIVSKFIVPIERRLDQDETRIGILEGFRRSTDTWRYEYVDPNIKQWRAFHEFFNGWPLGILNRWRDYFAHPAKFGEWAAPVIAHPLIAFLARGDERGDRDRLASMLTRAWTDEPEVIWREVQSWLLAGR